MRTRCAALVIGGILGCLAAPASADPKADIAAKTRAAMASYDAMDYDAARKLLNQALAIAKKAKLDRDPVVARVYLDLGIAMLAVSDAEGARLALLSAVQIDPRIAIDAAYKSPELVKLLDEARAAASGAADPDGDDCKTVRGLQHAIVDTARPGAAQAIEALVGADLSPARVVVMYRPEGAIDFTELRLARQGSCRYTAAIPGSAMRGNLVHYYIAVYDAGNRVLASKGSSGAPNVMQLARPGRPSGDAPRDPGAGDAEDPIRAGAVSGSAAPARTQRVMIAVTGGTGFGYVTGKTEGDNVVMKCCIGSSLFVVAGEVGYYANPRLSIGVAARIGFPIGANLAGHSTTAPAGFVRVRYALSASGDGFHAMGELGAGILRNTIKLDDIMSGMDTDIVAQGPVLVGAGIGYSRHLGASIALFIDLDAIAGIAVVDKVGSAIRLNSGLSADLNVGLALGF